MVETILITLLIVAISLVLLGVKVFFTKGGKFPNGHVSGNKALRKKGIGCAPVSYTHLTLPTNSLV